MKVAAGCCKVDPERVAENQAPELEERRKYKKVFYFDDFEAGAKGAMVTLTWVRNFDMEAADDMAGYMSAEVGGDQRRGSSCV